MTLSPSAVALLATIAAVGGAPAPMFNYPSGFAPDSTSDQPFICDYRKLAWEYAKKIQPNHDARITFDALMLGATCNMTRPSAPSPAAEAAAATTTNHTGASSCSIYVAIGGDDKKPGTSPTEAKATVAAGIAATRAFPADKKSLCIGAGTFYLDATVEVTGADSGLSIQGDASGGTWLSGAKNVPTLSWDQYKHEPGSTTMQIFNGTDNQHGCIPNDSSPIASGGCGCYSDVTTASACQAKCESMGPDKCKSFAWSDGKGTASSTGWANNCCIHADDVWSPTQMRGHVAGKYIIKPAVNVWKATLPTEFAAIRSPQMRVNGARSSRARFPDSNPETDIWPTGWVPNAEQWLPAKPPVTQPKFIQVQNAILQTRNDGTTIALEKNYSGGIGGPCEVFDPPFSYWCSAHPAGGGGFQYYVPSGMAVPSDQFPVSPLHWSKGGAGATVHAFRRSHWASWMFDVSNIQENGSNVNIKYGRGGYQGCRGGPGQDWFVENVLELLDSPNEHYIDTDVSPPVLYYFPNATGAPPSNLGAAVPMLQILLKVNTTQSDPVKGFSIKNVNFRDAATTYMEPHGVPSGGDWALERLGAIYLEGTTDFSMDSCQLERLDGNAMMLSGFNRGASVTNNHFAWTGGTAIAAWGRTDELSDGGIHGYDATAGDIPAGTHIEGNIMRESGIWEKQSSCFFQAKTAATTLLNNLCFNLPRAGFNFNDGLAGGDEVHFNLIFNSCRETSDHGPINSWDRQPYVSTFGITDGKPSAHMKPRNISFNFLVANYGGGNGAVDNDDESLRYDNNHNFQIYGHQKFKTGAIRSFGNVMAYLTDFGGKWTTPGTIADEPNVMFDNKVWFTDGAQYHNTEVDQWVGNRSYNNALVGSNITLSGGLTLEQWQAKNPKLNDVGSTYKNVPTSSQSAEIMAAARELLGM